jgi:hypothetical protein
MAAPIFSATTRAMMSAVPPGREPDDDADRLVDLVLCVRESGDGRARGEGDRDRMANLHVVPPVCRRAGSIDPRHSR